MKKIAALLASASLLVAMNSVPALAAPVGGSPGRVAHVDIGPRAFPSSSAAPNPDTRITLIAGLPRDSKRLDRRAQAVSSPSSWAYRDFTTLKSAGRAYGASAVAVRALKDAAGPLGIAVSVDRTRLFARLTATVATWEKLLGTKVSYSPAPHRSAGSENGPWPNATYVFVNSTDYLVPAPSGLAPYVREFLPFAVVYDVHQDIPGPVPPSGAQSRSIIPIGDDTLPWPTNTGSPLGTTCLKGSSVAGQVYTPRQTRDAYGTTQMRKDGARGSSARMTVVSLEGGFSRQDLAAYAKCFGVAKPTVHVHLGTGVPHEIVSYSTETHLDLQATTGALADARRIDLVQEANDGLGIGMLDGFARALDRNGKGTRSPDAVSLSYGQCELNLADNVQVGVDGLPLLPVMEDVFAMAGLVGTSLFASAGDYGSSACQMANAPSEPDGTVEYPASSPWITAVGGTRLALGAGNVRTSEVAWNDTVYGFPAAGTGGYSASFRKPWYQPGTFPRDRRTVPDVAALADIMPGWPVVYGGELIPVGGTSGSSPFTASNIALVSARERSLGRPGIGFANPWLYSRGASAFYDVTSGDNQVPVVMPGQYINAPACCQAVVGFDLVSGLGAPRFERLMAVAGG